MFQSKLFYTIIGILLCAFFINTPANGQYHRNSQSLPRQGERIVFARNRPGVVVAYGGVPYHYDNGIFYRPAGPYFEVVAPPIGIHVRLLPPYYRRIYIGTSIIFYYNGIFYRQNNTQDYEVVQPPVGADVTELPAGAKVLVLNGQKMYELDGTYYQEHLNDGQLWYTVVGKDGVVNTEPTETLQIGDTYAQLPEGCNLVVINNQKYYVSPDNIYYQEIIKDNKLLYAVVGK
ncbi:MAG: hypothetical protein COW65_04710 [Cytophagales bacterium CG18_big_fil_WC_8_21_14_2_50_42_9]|nr:MAG: hypothetical protein COW65_04710 [Cytophagales bacterium CG18_big_fil_WC_8_21_14_2_50_42_9]